MNTQFSAMKVAALEFLRLLVLSLPGIAVGIALQAWADNPYFSTGIGSIIFGALKSYDRSVHENPDDERNGIVPF